MHIPNEMFPVPVLSNSWKATMNRASGAHRTASKARNSWKEISLFGEERKKWMMKHIWIFNISVQDTDWRWGQGTKSIKGIRFIAKLQFSFLATTQTSQWNNVTNTGYTLIYIHAYISIYLSILYLSVKKRKRLTGCWCTKINICL